MVIKIEITKNERADTPKVNNHWEFSIKAYAKLLEKDH